MHYAIFKSSIYKIILENYVYVLYEVKQKSFQILSMVTINKNMCFNESHSDFYYLITQFYRYHSEIHNNKKPNRIIKCAT